MSDSFLAAASARAVDLVEALFVGAQHGTASGTPNVIFESADLTLLLFLHLDLSTRLMAAACCKAWLHTSNSSFALYANCDKKLLSRRLSHHALTRFRKLLGKHTTSLDLSNMHNLDDTSVGDILTVSGDMTLHVEPEALGSEVDSARMPNLRSLNLSGCDIGDDACFWVNRAGLRGMGHLREIHLWAAESITDAGIGLIAQACPLLEVLDLRCCGTVTGKCVGTLAFHCVHLTDLRLKGIRGVSDAALEALSKHCAKLVTLDVSGGKCTDAGLTALAGGCTSLQRLHLAANPRVGDAGVTQIAQACSQLRLLDLQGCATVGDDAALALASGLCAAALQTLSLQCCARVSDVGFERLMTSCQELRHVTLKNTLVSGALRDAMQAARPEVTVVDWGSS